MRAFTFAALWILMHGVATGGNSGPPAKQAASDTAPTLTSLRAGEVVSEEFRKTPEGDLSLWIHLPDDWSSDDRRPAIIFFFGGGWTNRNVKQFEAKTKAALRSKGRGADKKFAW